MNLSGCPFCCVHCARVDDLENWVATVATISTLSPGKNVANYSFPVQISTINQLRL